MARLSNQAKIKRLRSQGYSRKDLAKSFNVSVSSIGRAERGQTKGETFAAPLSEFFKLTKKAKANVVSGSISLPSAKPARAPRAKAAPVEIVSPLRRAEGKISEFDKDAKVVVQVTVKGTGKSRTLFAKGGTSKAHLQGNLRGVISRQYGVQYRGDAIDWDDVISIDIEEY